jgi:hypothetical protein
VAAVADASVSRILTLDGAKWRSHPSDLDEPLHIVEIADPRRELVVVVRAGGFELPPNRTHRTAPAVIETPSE